MPIPVCCPFHVDGGDPAKPCAEDIPASHFDFAEMEARMLALQAAAPPSKPRTISGRFPTGPTFAKGCGKKNS